MLFFSNCTATFQNRSFLSPLLDMVTREELTYTTEGKMLQTSGLPAAQHLCVTSSAGYRSAAALPVCPFRLEVVLGLQKCLKSLNSTLAVNMMLKEAFSSL